MPSGQESCLKAQWDILLLATMSIAHRRAQHTGMRIRPMGRPMTAAARKPHAKQRRPRIKGTTQIVGVHTHKADSAQQVNAWQNRGQCRPAAWCGTVYTPCTSGSLSARALTRETPPSYPVSDEHARTEGQTRPDRDCGQSLAVSTAPRPPRAAARSAMLGAGGPHNHTQAAAQPRLAHLSTGSHGKTFLCAHAPAT